MSVPSEPQSQMSQGRWAECFFNSLWLGLTSFGGPVAHIGYFEKAYVQRLRWLDAAGFAQLAALCQVLPGPASSQLNFLVGWQRGGPIGAFLSFLGFTFPSALLMIAAAVYATALGNVEILVRGLKLVAAIVVAQAVLSMMRGLCPDWPHRVLAALCAVLCAVAGGIYIQLGVIFLGAVFGRWRGRAAGAVAPPSALPAVISEKAAWRALVLFVLLLAVLPVFSLLADGGDALRLADVFYRSGALVFGGGHVVLPLLYDALPAAREKMVFFYGIAQALPGPLFTIAAALGYEGLAMAPLTGALTGLCFIFLPGLLAAVAGYYFWQKILSAPGLLATVSGIGAAVTGILAGALVDPVLTGAVRGMADAAFIAACVVFSVWRKQPVLVVIAACMAYTFLQAAYS